MGGIVKMKKIEGLKFLNYYFPGVALNGYAVSDVSKALDVLEKFTYADNNFWRIRTANPYGSEYALPMGTFHNDKAIIDFIGKMKLVNRDYQFILHRINDKYLNPNYCGTILVDNKTSNLIIDLQEFTAEKLLYMDKGMRPRDWNSCITFEYRFLNKFPIVSKHDSFSSENWKHEIASLYQIGIKIYNLYEKVNKIGTTYTRFNLYNNNMIILNDHRSSLSFV